MKSKLQPGTTLTTGIITLGLALFTHQSAQAITVTLATGSNPGPWALTAGANTFNVPNDNVAALIDGEISGPGNLLLQNIDSNNAVRRVTVNVPATYSGNTVLKSVDARFGVSLGIDNAFPITTSLQFQTTNNGTGRPVWLDLNGFSQEFTGIGQSGPTYNAIVNGNTATAGALIVNNSSDFTYSSLLGEAGAQGNIANQVSGSGANFSLTKKGTGMLTLTRINSYTGDTTVAEGTLSIQNAYLADAADVSVASGAVLDLNFVGTDIIDELIFDGVAQTGDTWGAIGSGADNESSRLTGTGLLQVTTPGPGGTAPFVITAINYDPDTDSVVLTWTILPNPDTNYIAKFSTDMTNFDGDLADDLSAGLDENPDDGEQITVTFSLTTAGLEDLADLFFRIEEQP